MLVFDNFLVNAKFMVDGVSILVLVDVGLRLEDMLFIAKIMYGFQSLF